MNVLLDLYLEKNLGDDLFLQAILEKYPTVNWYILTREDYKSIEKKYQNLKVITPPKGVNYLIHNFKLSLWMTKYITNKYKIDAMATVGGSIFIEYEGWEQLYKIREKNWLYYKKNNKPVFVIGANFGAYHTELFLEQYKKLLNEVTDVCFRDQYSATLFKELNNVRFEADIIMGYTIDSFKKNKINESVGISIMNLKQRPKLQHLQERYLKKMAELTQRLLDDGYDVHLMSFCKSEGDEEAIELIAQKIGNNSHLRKCYYTGNVNNFLNEFSKLKYVIGCRFHSIILAYIFSKPVLPIIYSKKTSDYLLEWRIMDELIDLHTIDELPYEKLLDIFHMKNNIEPELIKSAEKQFHQFDLWLEKSNK